MLAKCVEQYNHINIILLSFHHQTSDDCIAYTFATKYIMIIKVGIFTMYVLYVMKVCSLLRHGSKYSYRKTPWL